MSRLLDTLTRCYEYDVEVLSQPWMYWCLCIPAVVYVGFMMVKWTVLTCPVWLPIKLLITVCGNKEENNERPTRDSSGSSSTG